MQEDSFHPRGRICSPGERYRWPPRERYTVLQLKYILPNRVGNQIQNVLKGKVRSVFTAAN